MNPRHFYIYIYIHICLCVYVCVCEITVEEIKALHCLIIAKKVLGEILEGDLKI